MSRVDLQALQTLAEANALILGAEEEEDIYVKAEEERGKEKERGRDVEMAAENGENGDTKKSLSLQSPYRKERADTLSKYYQTPNTAENTQINSLLDSLRIHSDVYSLTKREKQRLPISEFLSTPTSQSPSTVDFPSLLVSNISVLQQCTALREALILMHEEFRKRRQSLLAYYGQRRRALIRKWAELLRFELMNLHTDTGASESSMERLMLPLLDKFRAEMEAEASALAEKEGTLFTNMHNEFEAQRRPKQTELDVCMGIVEDLGLQSENVVKMLRHPRLVSDREIKDIALDFVSGEVDWERFVERGERYEEEYRKSVEEEEAELSRTLLNDFNTSSNNKTTSTSTSPSKKPENNTLVKSILSILLKEGMFSHWNESVLPKRERERKGEREREREGEREKEEERIEETGQISLSPRSRSPTASASHERERDTKTSPPSKGIESPARSRNSSVEMDVHTLLERSREIERDMERREGERERDSEREREREKERERENPQAKERNGDSIIRVVSDTVDRTVNMMKGERELQRERERERYEDGDGYTSSEREREREVDEDTYTPAPEKYRHSRSHELSPVLSSNALGMTEALLGLAATGDFTFSADPYFDEEDTVEKPTRKARKSTKQVIETAKKKYMDYSHSDLSELHDRLHTHLSALSTSMHRCMSPSSYETPATVTERLTPVLRKHWVEVRQYFARGAAAGAEGIGIHGFTGRSSGGSRGGTFSGVLQTIEERGERERERSWGDWDDEDELLKRDVQFLYETLNPDGVEYASESDILRGYDEFLSTKQLLRKSLRRIQRKRGEEEAAM